MNDMPFRGSAAVRRGEVTRNDLRRRYRRLYRDVYLANGTPLTAATKAHAAWLSTGATLAGVSAAAVLGTKWLDADAPAEIVRTDRHRQPGLIVHSYELAEDEVCVVRGMRATTPARTAFDIGRRLGIEAGVQHLDALINATHLKAVDVEAVASRHPGIRGLRQLRRTLDLVDGGAESPYESLTRLLLVQAGFPRPQTQIPVLDEYGNVFARIDMGWEEWRVGVDFEGKHHWTDPRQRNWDVERFARLPELGWNDIRLTSGILHHNPQRFLDRVGAALIARGCPKTW
jgi:hypothetical protein